MATGLSVCSLFSNNMGLQKGTSRVFGKAVTGTIVTVTLTNTATGSSQSLICPTCSSGRWSGELDTPVAGGNHTLVISSSDTTITCTNCTIGRGFVVQGQSQCLVATQADTVNWAAEEIALTASPYPDIRMFRVAKQRSIVEEDDFGTPANAHENVWDTATATNVAGVSAIGYWTAKALHIASGEPVFFIVCAQGGTQSEEWMKELSWDEVEAAWLADNPSFTTATHRPIFHTKIASITHGSSPNYYPIIETSTAHDLVDGRVVDLTGLIDNASLNTDLTDDDDGWMIQVIDDTHFYLVDDDFTDEIIFVADDVPTDGYVYQNKTASLWNGMLHPISRYSVENVIVDHGEADTLNARVYPTYYERILSDWRTNLGDAFMVSFVNLSTTGYDMYAIAQQFTVTAVSDSGINIYAGLPAFGNYIKITTAEAHSLADNSRVWITGAATATEINDTWYIHNLTPVDNHNFLLGSTLWPQYTPAFVHTDTSALVRVAAPRLLDEYMGRQREAISKLVNEYTNIHKISALDCNAGYELHYTDKTKIGTRACNIIRTYNDLSVAAYQGPIYEGQAIGSKKLTLTFSNCGTGLGAETPANPIKGFWVCNNTQSPRVWVEANVRLVAATAITQIELTTRPCHWATGTVYAAGNLVTYNPTGKFYVCATNHTAGTFATDLAAVKWVETTMFVAWVTGTDYKVGHVISSGSKYYRCIVAHTAGTWATDLAAGKWIETWRLTADQPSYFRYNWHWYRETNHLLNSDGIALDTVRSDIYSYPDPWGEPY